MTRSVLLRFIVGAFSAAALAHVATSVLAAAALRELYPHRIYDVRKWSDDAVASFRLVGSFLNENAVPQDRPVIVFAGSSVTFGYRFPEQVTFARLFADRHQDARVLNVSIIAADVSAVNDWIVCAARRNDVHVDTLVIELPVVNTLTYLVKGQQSGHAPPPLSVCERSDRDPGYLRLALTAFRGTGWLGFFWTRTPLLGSDGPVQIERVPKGSFAGAPDFDTVRRPFAEQIATTLRNAAIVGRRVYAFPSPVFAAGLDQIGEDSAALRAQLNAALDACRSVASIGCIDPSALYDESRYFYNFTHLNHAGHRAMADLVSAHVAVP